MFKKNFKEFDFRGFVDFVLELLDKYGLGEIRFSPEHKENFSEVQHPKQKSIAGFFVFKMVGVLDRCFVSL